MNTFKSHDRPFSVTRFIFVVSITFAVYVVLICMISPSSWRIFIKSSFLNFSLVFLIAHLCNAFIEHAFHRYMLHMQFPFLKRLYKQHTLHHKLTVVKLLRVKNGTGKIFNRYPILTDTQHTASYFPWYAPASFIVVSLVVVFPLQWLMPSWPIAIAVPFAVTWSMTLYELVHMVEHLSFETFWKPKIIHPRFGPWWTSVYCFHLRHHADISSNENVSGFFGIPVADFVWGTYAPWSRPFLHGESVSVVEFDQTPPRPRLLLRILDSALLRGK